MDMLDKRLNDKGKNWRHVLKSLKVLDYCLHEGSELVVTWARKNIYIIKTLREFIYLEDDSHDVGQNGKCCAGTLLFHSGITDSHQCAYRPKNLLHSSWMRSGCARSGLIESRGSRA